MKSGVRGPISDLWRGGQCVFYLCMALCLSRPASRAPPASRNAVTAGARAAFWQVVEQDPGGGVLLSNHKSCLLCLQPRGGEKTERGRSRHKSSVTLPLHLSHSVLVFFFPVGFYLSFYILFSKPWSQQQP